MAQVDGVLCYFNTNLFVIVNGSLTLDFKPYRGLSQGVPLSPFLFQLATKGLTSLISKASQIRALKGVRIS